jgi:hypothetical protein
LRRPDLPAHHAPPAYPAGEGPLVVVETLGFDQINQRTFFGTG